MHTEIIDKPRWISLSVAMEIWNLDTASLFQLSTQRRPLIGQGPMGSLFIDLDKFEELIVLLKPNTVGEEIQRWISINRPAKEESFTLTKASAFARVGPATIRQAVRNGELLAKRIGSSKKAGYAIEKRDLDKWIQNKSVSNYDVYRSALHETQRIKTKLDLKGNK